MDSILIVINNLNSGGTEHHLLQVLPLLQLQLRHKIYIYVMSDRGKLASAFEKHGITVIVPNNKSNICSIFCLIKTIYKIKPKLIHCFLTKAYLSAAFVNIIYRRPLVMSRRSLNYYQKKHPFLSRLEYFTHRFASAFLGNSQAVINQLLAEGIDKEKVRLIYNAIDTRLYQKKLGFVKESKHLTMIIVANLRAYKGHLDLFQALFSIAEKLPKTWRLHCLGRDDGILVELKKTVRELKLENHIFFVGECEKVADFFLQSDIAISCSYEEGFSNSILEAMASGLPVIATNVGGNPEAVIDQQTGLIVPAGSPGDLAEAILKLALEPALRRELGEKGRQRIEESFKLDQCVTQYKHFYEEVIKQ